nr:YTH domain-containing protein 1-like isoform X1 [Dermacentor andersoni]
MTSQDAENKDMEVNVLDELLENADDDDLAAELNNEEKKVGKRMPLTPSTPPSTKASLAAAAAAKKNSATAKPVKRVASADKTSSQKKMLPPSKAPPSKPTSTPKKKPPANVPISSASVGPSTSATVSSTSSTLAQSKSSSQPKLVKKIPQTKIAAKSPTTAEKPVVMKAKPVVSATGEPKMSAEDLLTAEQAAQKGMVIKKTVAKKIPTTHQTQNKPIKKVVAPPKAAAVKVSETTSATKVKPEKVAVTAPKPSAVSPSVVVASSKMHVPDEDPDRLHVTPTAEELQVAEEPLPPPPMVSGGSSSSMHTRTLDPVASFVMGGGSSRMSCVSEGRGGGNTTANPDYDTRSEASSSGHESCSCSLGSSTSRSRSVSRSRSRSRSQSYSGSSSAASEPGNRSPRHHVSRKRRHSPIIYDRKNRSVERTPKRPRVSSSVGRRDISEHADQHLMKYFFRNARFFLVKSNNHENVVLSKAKGVWSTPPQNEAKLNQAFRECKNVILIYSVKESGKFQGFARLASESNHDCPTIQWVLPPGLSARALGGVFQVDWICRRELPFTKTAHLYNPWNDGKQVKIGRDGQEIEPRVAEELCQLFPVDENIDLRSILRRRGRSSRRSPTHRRRTPSRRSASPCGRGHRHRHARTGGRDEARLHLARVHSRRSRNSHGSHSPRPRHRRESSDDGYRLARRGRYGPDHEMPMDRYPVRRDQPSMNGKSFWEMHLQAYQDYLREYHHHQRPPLPPMPYGPPPPFPMDAMPYHYDRNMHHIDYNHGVASRTSRQPEKRSYEMTVDDFIRRTARPPPSRVERRYRERR